MDIKKIIAHYVTAYKTDDPFDLADCLKIVVRKGSLGDCCGCYMYLKKHRCILINKNLDHHSSRVVMAHELGHAILHIKTNCCFMRHKTLLNTSKIERQANKFAAELLISDSVINQYKDFNTAQIASILGVDLQLIKLKIGED